MSDTGPIMLGTDTRSAAREVPTTALNGSFVGSSGLMVVARSLSTETAFAPPFGATPLSALRPAVLCPLEAGQASAVLDRIALPSGSGALERSTPRAYG